MANFAAQFRVAPGKWIGLSPPYNPEFIDWLKSALPVKAWDPQTKTWWTPEGYWPLIKVKILELNQKGPFVNQRALDAFDRALYGVGVRVVSSEGTQSEVAGRAAAFAKLGLTPDAPPPVVDMVYGWMKRQYANAAGHGVAEIDLDEAYQTILSLGPNPGHGQG